MTKSKLPTDIAKEVMSKIKKDHVTMKPKGYFLLGSILLGIGLASAFLIALTFLTVSSFHLRTSNPVGFLRYGAIGAPAFFRLFPFIPLVIAATGIFGGLALLKKYDISYKKNFLSISLSLIAGLITIALIADKVGINERLEKSPPLKAIYRQEFNQNDMLMGEIVSIKDNSMIVKNPRTNQETVVTWDESTNIQNPDGFEAGDHVGVVGEKIDQEFFAKGIHEGGMGWRKEVLDSSESANPMPKVKGVQQIRKMR
jgi:hypothetical protein